MTATVVIVNYRAYAELQSCLASLARCEPDAAIVVVDHAADFAEASRLSAAFPRVAYRATHENPGFGAGVNAAAREAGAGALLLLNPDCELTMPLLGPLLSVLEHDSAAGVVGGLVRESDGTVQASARRFPDATTGLAGRTSWLSRVAPDNPLTRRNLTTDPSAGLRQVDWVSGALMLIRRETFDAIGGFDERFFLYWEDADFCRRAARAGWSTWYAPDAEVVHRTARASRHAPVRSLAAFHVSAFRYHWKHGGVWARLASPVTALVLAARFLVRVGRRAIRP
jgi:N-acetylglucosaminyl-diphospho-decaprenol L-rhamnosyltransferase